MANQFLIFKGGSGASSSGGGDTTVVLGTFKALANGVGYADNDLIILRQVGTAPPEWYNATSQSIIAAPTTTHLGSVSASSNVSVTASALPTGAATEAKQLPNNHQVTVSNSSIAVNDGNSSLTIDGTVTANTGLLQPLTDAQLRNSAVPVSLTSVPSHAVTNAGTFAVQSTNQANSGVDIGDVTINNGVGSAAVNIQDGGNSLTVDGTVDATQSGTWAVDISNFPSGLATTALQITGNQSLDNIDNKLPALSSGSIPVSLPTSQITTLTPPPAITGFATAVKQPSLGSAGIPSPDVITVQGISGGTNLPVALSTADNTALDDIITGTTNITSAVTALYSKFVSGTDIGDVTVNNGSGGAAVNIQDGGNSITVDGGVDLSGTAGTNLSSINTKLPSNLTVTATRLLVDGSGVTQPVSGTVTANTGLSQPLTNTELRASPPTVQLTSTQITTLTPPAAITGFATETTLASILTALNGNVNFSETIWTDDTGAYFARRVTQDLDTNTITVAYFLPNGNSYTPGANPRPVTGSGGEDREIISTFYLATANGTGYTAGDRILRSDVVSTSTGSVVVSLWFNASTKSYIAAPVSGDIVYNNNDGLATASNQIDGSQKSIIRGGTKGTTASADVTSTNASANRQPLDVTIYDASGNAVSSFGGAGVQYTGLFTTDVSPTGTLALGYDFNNEIVSPLSVDNTGRLLAVPTLATNAATETKQDTGNTQLLGINNKIPSNLTVTAGRLLTDSSGTTQPISVTSLPLPSGAAIASKQPALGVAGTPSADVLTVQGVTSMTPFKVDGSDTTQPISAVSLPLPSGAATSALQNTANSALSSIDAKLPTLGQALAASSVPVVLTAAQLSALTPFSSVSISGNLPAFSSTPTFNIGTIGGISTEATLSALDAKIPNNLTVTSTRLLVDGSGVTQPISAASLPLPSGSATSALQTTANASLSSIDGKIPSLGQALEASSVPVVLTAAQLSTLTPLSSVQATQSGLWGVSITPSSTVRISTQNNVPAQIGSGAKVLKGLIIYNPGTSNAYFKVWNSSSTPTVGTTASTMTPLLIEAGTTFVEYNMNINFLNGLWIAATLNFSDSTNVAPSTELDITVIWQ